MLVVLHFHQLGYSPLEVAMLFLFYEIFGVVTNLIGGWFGSPYRPEYDYGAGLLMRVVVSMLLSPDRYLVVAGYAAQALSVSPKT